MGFFKGIHGVGLVSAVNVDAQEKPGHADLVLMAIASTGGPMATLSSPP